MIGKMLDVPDGRDYYSPPDAKGSGPQRRAPPREDQSLKRQRHPATRDAL